MIIKEITELSPSLMKNMEKEGFRFFAVKGGLEKEGIMRSMRNTQPHPQKFQNKKEVLEYIKKLEKEIEDTYDIGFLGALKATIPALKEE